MNIIASWRQTPAYITVERSVESVSKSIITGPSHTIRLSDSVVWTYTGTTMYRRNNKHVSQNRRRMGNHLLIIWDKNFNTHHYILLHPPLQYPSSYKTMVVCNECSSWWRHQMETFSALLAICAGNSPVPGEFPTQRPVTRSIDVFFDLRPNKRLSNQWRGWWFETQSRSLWRHRNVHCDLRNNRFLFLILNS